MGILAIRADERVKNVHFTEDTISVDLIAKALQGINPAAADEFVRLYLGDYLQDQD